MKYLFLLGLWDKIVFSWVRDYSIDEGEIIEKD